MKWFKFLIILIIMELIIGVFIWCIWTIPNEDTTKNVNCYDKNNNIILGVECEETVYGLDKLGKILTSCILPIVGLLFTFSIAYPDGDNI